MHVIAKPMLVEFWTTHPDAQAPLLSWLTLIEKGNYTNFNALRATFASADYVDGLTIFNIGGNKYRLVALIHFNRGKVFVRNVMTHAEYDRGQWKKR